MKRLSLLILLVFAVLGQTFSQVAEKIGEEKAFQTAKAFVSTQTRFQNTALHLVSNSDLFIYNIGSQGFVIISSNTVLPPILGWSDQGNFPDLADAPENFTSWLQHYSEMIDFAVANNIVLWSVRAGIRIVITMSIVRPLREAAGGAALADMSTRAVWLALWLR